MLIKGFNSLSVDKLHQNIMFCLLVALMFFLLKIYKTFYVAYAKYM